MPKKALLIQLDVWRPQDFISFLKNKMQARGAGLGSSYPIQLLALDGLYIV